MYKVSNFRQVLLNPIRLALMEIEWQSCLSTVQVTFIDHLVKCFAASLDKEEYSLTSHSRSWKFTNEILSWEITYLKDTERPYSNTSCSVIVTGTMSEYRRICGLQRKAVRIQFLQCIFQRTSCWWRESCTSSVFLRMKI